MRKLWLLIGALAGLALGLVACEPSAASLTATPQTPASTPVLASSPVAAAPTLPLLPTTEPAFCTVTSRLPTPGPTEVSLFPGVSQSDWKLGPDGAKVVFMEYGDFQ
jgi:hypothetical protein